MHQKFYDVKIGEDIEATDITHYADYADYRELIGSLGIKGSAQPQHAVAFDQYRVKTTRRRRATTHQVIAGGKNNAPLLGAANAGTGTAKGATGTAAYFDKHQRAIALAQDQIDLAAAAPWGSIIALQQPQARRLQMGQRPVFGGTAALARAASCCFFTKEFH